MAHEMCLEDHSRCPYIVERSLHCARARVVLFPRSWTQANGVVPLWFQFRTPFAGGQGRIWLYSAALRRGLPRTSSFRNGHHSSCGPRRRGGVGVQCQGILAFLLAQRSSKVMNDCARPRGWRQTSCLQDRWAAPFLQRVLRAWNVLKGLRHSRDIPMSNIVRCSNRSSAEWL